MADSMKNCGGEYKLAIEEEELRDILEDFSCEPSYNWFF